MADNEKLNLLADFAPVSAQQWKDKIIADLKGADFDKKLVWRTPEGFNVQPFYRREDLKGLRRPSPLPGSSPTYAAPVRTTSGLSARTSALARTLARRTPKPWRCSTKVSRPSVSVSTKTN